MYSSFVSVDLLIIVDALFVFEPAKVNPVGLKAGANPPGIYPARKFADLAGLNFTLAPGFTMLPVIAVEANKS